MLWRLGNIFPPLVLIPEIRQRVKELFEEIAAHHGFEMKELEVAKDHVHVFLGVSSEVLDCEGGGDSEGGERP